MGIRRTSKNKESLLNRAHIGNVESPQEILNLARQYGINTKPLDVEMLLRKLGIDVIYSDQLDSKISGELKKNSSGTWTCLVNSQHHHTRQRLTLAHELGHYLLHRTDHEEFVEYSYYRKNDSSDVMEYEANFFAGAILMPEEDIIYHVCNISKNIDDIAKCFGVSPIAVSVRLKQLGY